MLEERSQRGGGGNKSSTGTESRGVLFTADLRTEVEDFVNTNFALNEWPTLKVGQVLTGLMYAGVRNPEAVAIIKEYIDKNAPNTKVSKAANMVESLTPEEKAALIKRLGL